MTVIRSADNPRIKDLKKLQKSASARRKADAWVVEGERLCLDLARGGASVREAYLREDAEGPLITAWMDVLAARGLRPTVLSPGAYRAFSDTQTPQGVAMVVAPPSHCREELLAGPGPVVILDRITDPGNVGTIFRSAAAAGASGLVLTAGSVDPGNPKVLRGSMGAVFRLPWLVENTPGEAMEWLGRPLVVATGDGDTMLGACALATPFALVVGNEAHGPDPAWRSRPHTALAIEMAAGVESLNVAVAASVILFEAARQRKHHDAFPRTGGAC